MIRLTRLSSVFAAEAADVVSSKVIVKHFDYLVLQVGTAALTDGKIMVRGSVDSSADLSLAQAVDNIWGYKYMYDLNSGSGIQGSTGISPAGEEFYELKINVDALYQMALEISGRTAGAYTANLYGVNINGQ